jgi:hypothetical protein
MARANECIFTGIVISVEKALEIRDATTARKRKLLGFECTECGQTVRPHKAGGSAAAHFKHLSRNPQCNLSDPHR